MNTGRFEPYGWKLWTWRKLNTLSSSSEGFSGLKQWSLAMPRSHFKMGYCVILLYITFKRDERLFAKLKSGNSIKECFEEKPCQKKISYKS